MGSGGGEGERGFSELVQSHIRKTISLISKMILITHPPQTFPGDSLSFSFSPPKIPTTNSYNFISSNIHNRLTQSHLQITTIFPSLPFQ